MYNIFEGRLVFPDSVTYGQLSINNGKIENILVNPEEFSTPNVKLPEDQLICPGFVDVQINGSFGKEFKSDVDAIGIIRANIPKFGTTSFCPTVTTRPLNTYSEHLESLMNNIGEQGAKILGFHLEGPFLNPSKVGAQNADLLHAPSDCAFDEFPTKNVSIVTLSPELDGSKEFINKLIENGIKVGVGHSLIPYEELISLFDEKHMMIVHVFNAMADLNSRKPGVVGVALERDDYFVSLIADGIHVDPVTVRIFWKAKSNKEKVICITDGSAVAGMEIGVHQIGTRSIEKREDRAVLEGTETLVGSILTLNVAAKNLMHFTQCSLNEAINCVTLNPATYLGRQDEIGQLRVGNAADLVVMDDSFNVKQTYIDGELAWSIG